jgi:hypothetical protein
MQKIIFLLCLWAVGIQTLPAKSIVGDTTKRIEQQAQGREADLFIEEPETTQEQSYYKKNWRDKIKKTPHKFGKKHKKMKPKGNFIELDALMVTLAFVLGIAFLMLLWLLFKLRNNLGFGWALLLAIGFALALFFWLLANSENVDTVAGYEYFIKFGIFAFVGLLLLLGGFIALFGGVPNMGKFLLWGLVLGGISLIISIIFRNSVLNEIFPYWFR